MGFTRAQVSLPMSSATPDQRGHRFHAGLFELHLFHDLVLLQRALWDGSSAINLFAIEPGTDRKHRLLRALRSPSPPPLADVLDEGELLIDLTIGMDMGVGVPPGARRNASPGRSSGKYALERSGHDQR
ncbi:hypothetical protein [Sphaerimonospora thailandensis]|uniref:hypothetical protein n=1 Tax=Sphaerimonospora thailandensis TaxID=795644 RepID=UPI00194DFBED|nr:hypothetical protein [Sphaerimonospora thailandensis]